MKTNLIVLFVLLLCGACSRRDTDLSVRELARMIEKETLMMLIDVRTPQEYRMGTIPGAINIPLQMMPLMVQEIQRVREDQPKIPVIVFCRTQNRSNMAAHILTRHDIHNVRVAPGVVSWGQSYELNMPAEQSQT